MKNYYKILGIRKSAGDDEIKRVYRKLALEYHPDRHSGDDRKFKEISEAYAVLKDPAKRAEHDLDLKQEELKSKPRTETTHRTTSASDFGGKADPTSQRGMWDDVQSNDPVGYQRASRYTTGNVSGQMRDVVGHWIRPVSTVLIVFAILLGVSVFAFHQLTGTGSDIPTITPQANNNSNSQSNNSIGDGGNFATPTPTPTPAQCPTGEPSIQVTNVQQDTSDSSGDSYVISGTLTNSSTASIDVNSVGFYFGPYSQNTPPSSTDTFADMLTSGNVPVAPGLTVDWSSTQTITGDSSSVTASLDYPPNVGDQVTPQWYFTGDVAQNCQPSSVSSD